MLVQLALVIGVIVGGCSGYEGAAFFCVILLIVSMM